MATSPRKESSISKKTGKRGFWGSTRSPRANADDGQSDSHNHHHHHHPNNSNAVKSHGAKQSDGMQVRFNPLHRNNSQLTALAAAQQQQQEEQVEVGENNDNNTNHSNNNNNNNNNCGSDDDDDHDESSDAKKLQLSSSPGPFPGIRLRKADNDGAGGGGGGGADDAQMIRQRKERERERVARGENPSLLVKPLSFAHAIKRVPGGCVRHRNVGCRRFRPADAIDEAAAAAEREARESEFCLRLRKQVMEEFAESERLYGETLREVDPGIKAAFVSQVKNGDPLVTNVMVTDIFGKVATLVVVSMDVGMKLAAAKDDWAKLTAMFNALNEYMAVYREYSMHYKSASYTLHRLLQSLPSDHDLRNVLNAVNLHALLRRPLERLDEYQWTLARVRDLTPPSAPEYVDLCAAVQRMHAIVGSLEERRERLANAELLLDFQKLLVAKKHADSLPLFIQKKERRFVGMQRFASVSLRHRKKLYRPGIVWLLSDVLVVTCDAPGSRYKLLAVIDLVSTHIIVSAETSDHSAAASAAESSDALPPDVDDDDAGDGGIVEPSTSTASLAGTSSLGSSIAGDSGERGWLFSITSPAEQHPQRIVIEAPNKESRRLWMDTITSIVMELGRTGSARRLAASLSTDKLLDVAAAAASSSSSSSASSSSSSSSSSGSSTRSSAPTSSRDSATSKAKRVKRLRRRSGMPSATAASLENVAAATDALPGANDDGDGGDSKRRNKARRVRSCDNLEADGESPRIDDGDDIDDSEPLRTPRSRKARKHHHTHKHRKHRKSVSGEELNEGGTDQHLSPRKRDDDDDGRRSRPRKSPRKRYPGSLKEPLSPR